MYVQIKKAYKGWEWQLLTPDNLRLSNGIAQTYFLACCEAHDAMKDLSSRSFQVKEEVTKPGVVHV